MNIVEKFERLGVENAPGQEVRKQQEDLPVKGDAIPGVPVDFSHGDIDAHPPIPGSIDAYVRGFEQGGAQAYTEYRGRSDIRIDVARKLSDLTGSSIDPGEELILTPGTQGALFLAMGACLAHGDKAAYVEPDYFANRKLIEFFEGEAMPIPMRRLDAQGIRDTQGDVLDFGALEQAFAKGARLLLLSNPNNPTGAVYGKEELERIAALCKAHGTSLIVDELYSRQMYESATFTHAASLKNKPDHLITIIGPSKTESMSGFRMGVAFGSRDIIRRMEKLQAIATLRCAGYSQAVFQNWLSEPEGWLSARVSLHESIRNELSNIFRSAGVQATIPQGGSYLFVRLPRLCVKPGQFIALLRAQASVVVTPGTEFGKAYTDWFRINFSQDKQNACDAARRIVALIDRYKA